MKQDNYKRPYAYSKILEEAEYSCFAVDSYDISGAEVHDNNLFIFIDGLCGRGFGNTTYNDCMLVLKNFCYNRKNHEYMEESIRKMFMDITNRSIEMSFREFLLDGCMAEQILYNSEDHSLRIMGYGHRYLNASSELVDMSFSFDQIELFWNAEYDYMTGKKIRGQVLYFEGDWDEEE